MELALKFEKLCLRRNESLQLVGCWLFLVMYSNSSLYHIVLYAERLRFIILILPEHLSCDRYFSISILFILFYILAFVNKLCTSTGV